MSDVSSHSEQTTLLNNATDTADSVQNSNNSNNNNNNIDTNEEEEEEDPLSVKQLSLNFEYLMYKINDRVKTLSEQTEEVVVAQNDRYFKDIEMINMDLKKIEKLTVEYSRIMDEFVKLEQLSYILKDFNTRLEDIELKLKKI